MKAVWKAVYCPYVCALALVSILISQIIFGLRPAQAANQKRSLHHQYQQLSDEHICEWFMSSIFAEANLHPGQTIDDAQNSAVETKLIAVEVQNNKPVETNLTEVKNKNWPVETNLTGAIEKTNPVETNLIQFNEVDYASGGAPLFLDMTIAGTGSDTPIAPAGSLTLTPITVTAQAVGTPQTVTLKATDAAGAAVASLPVVLTISGVNPQQLTATTDPTGQALFTYTGTRGGGTDNLQAQATLSGMPTTSNVATVPWSGPVNQAPVVNAGLPVTVTFPNTAVLSGSATDDGLPTPSSLTYSWSMLSGPGTVTFGAPNLASTTANFSIPGTYQLQLSVSDTLLTGVGLVTVTVNTAGSGPSLVLSPASSGPRVINSVQQLTAKLKDITGSPVVAATVSFTVTGVNPSTGSSITDATGTATFAATGTATGIDTIRASASVAGTAIESNTASISWVNTAKPIIMSSVKAQYFAGDNTPNFTTVFGQQPLFIQSYPSMSFNPRSGIVTGNSDTSYQNPPWINVTTDLNGNYTGTILPQGNGFIVGDTTTLPSFNAVITGELHVGVPGNYLIRAYHDDGFYWGIGGGATRIAAGSSGFSNPPASGLTAFYGYPLMGSDNNPSNAPVDTVINFPVAGTYPFEYDLAAKLFDATFNWEGTFTTIIGGVEKIIPPSGYIAMTPNTLPSQLAGTSLTFSLTVVDASGALVANTPIVLSVTGVNAQQLTGVTNASGQASFTYTGIQPGGFDTVQATATINGATGYSNSVRFSWNNGVNQAPVVTAGTAQSVVLPANGTLTGSVKDDGLPLNSVLTITWTKVSGPGGVTFANPHSPLTTATFDVAGTYVLQLSATDSALTSTATVTVTVTGSNSTNPPGTSEPGWISGVTDRGNVSGVVTISVPVGTTLTSGVLSYYSVTDPTATPIVITPSTVGTGTIGTLDTTLLPNGSYWIQLNATNNVGLTQNNVAMVTVVGDYKPGRVTASITDLTVPAPGLPISIVRSYDSLERNKVQDFGNGWSLSTNVKLEVDPSNNVTLTLNGKRRTFYFTPQPNGIFVFFYLPQYTPEAGMYGSLTNTTDNCLGVLIRVGNLYQCGIQAAGNYQANGFVYTDPYGRVYTIGNTGTLQSIKDLIGNTLTVTPTGISSTNGLSVPFVRDTQGRITRITDPQGHQYNYTYDTAGNLATVSYPGIATAAQYQYNATHLLTQERDQRGNIAGSTIYYPDGKLQSVTDAVGNTTQYAYDTTLRKTTITNPDNGTALTVHDAYGKPTSVTDALNRVTTSTYSTNRDLLTQTDPLGKITTYTYDGNGFQTSKKDPLNNLSSTTFNVAGGPTSVTDPLNQITNLTYDANFRISTITDSIGPIAQVTYNTVGLPLTIKDARGNTSSNVYDQYGNLTSATDALGRTKTSAYNTMGNLTSETDPRGNSTTYVYDAYNRRTAKIDATGKSTIYTYDGNGNKITETDRNNHQTASTYDNANRLIQVRYADNTTRSYTYDFRGNKLTETDQLGRVTKTVYDLAGQVTTMTVAFGTADAATTAYTYDLAGRKLTQVDPRGNTITNTYDAAGRMTSMKDGVNNLTQYGYDTKSQRTSMTDGKNRITTYTYDARSRQLSSVTPDGKTTSKTYDGMGKVLTTADEEGRSTTFGYDAANQLLSVTDALSQITRYTYDLAGNKLTQVDANNHTTSYAWDSLNRRIFRTLPLGQTEAYTYDFETNMLTRRDFNGKTTTYSYDSLNRQLSRTPDAFFAASPISFIYTLSGQRQQMTDASGVTNYSYSNRDQVLTKATPQGTLTYTYDLASNVASVLSSNANGTSVSYAWDQKNRLSGVTDNRTSGTTNYNYDSTNQLLSFAYPNGVTHGYGYDSRDRTTGLNVNGPSGVITSYVQAFSFSGRKANVAESSGRTENYTYDQIYRLQGEAISGEPVAANNGSLNYSLDPVGNRNLLTSTLAALPNQASTYDPNDRLNTDTYDANSNTLTSGGVTYGYEFEDRLVSVSTGVQIIYDGDGNRVSETTGGVTTKFLVDEKNPTGWPQVAEEIVGGAVTALYTHGLMRISQNRGGIVSYYGYDGGGSVRQLLNPSGTVTDTYAYDAFGNTIARTGSTVNPYQYRGEQFDSELQMYYLRDRYYVPKTGRFLTQDKYEGSDYIALCGCGSASKQPPVDPRHHLFLYTGTDPVNFIDPSGKGPILDGIVLRVWYAAEFLVAQRKIIGSSLKVIGCVGTLLYAASHEVNATVITFTGLACLGNVVGF